MTGRQTSGAGNLASLISAFGPLFLGSGKQTTTTTPDAEALATSRGISRQALSNADNAETVTNDIVNRIITKNANAFGTNLAASHVAGLYNSTTMNQLAGEAQASSSAEASKTVLDYRTNQLAIASRASGDVLSASKTQTTQTAPSIDPMVSMLLGGGITSYSAYKNRNLIKSFLGLDEEEAVKEAAAGQDAGQIATDSAFGSGGSTSGDASEELGLNLPPSDIEESGSMSSVTLGELTPAQIEAVNAPDTSGSEVTATTDALTGTDASLSGAEDTVDIANNGEQLIDAGTGEIATDAGGTVAADALASEGAVEAAGAISADVPYLNILASLIYGFSGDTEAAGGAMTGASAVAPIVEGLNNILPDSIICAELKRQGLLNDSLARRSLHHFRKYKEVSRDAYYIWATPSVKHLKKFPQSYYSKALRNIFTLRSEYVSKRKSILSYGAYYLVSAITVSCWPLLKLRNILDAYKFNRYLKHLYKGF